MQGLIVAAAAALAAAQSYGPITNLPGWSGAQNMYSGYITVNATSGRQLFFWFVESSQDPANDPLVFWTNGGPGCSSLGGGLFSEHGPFRPDPAGSGGLVANPWSWSNVANMLYVEQPAGVGFSYSNTTSDYTVGDARAADDVYQFMQTWLATPEFSQYRSNQLIITGESYGGHYVPSITARIVEQNLNNPQEPKINIGGFLVGNAWTDAFYDNSGAVEMWYWHGMISNETRNGILNTCNMSDVGPLARESKALASSILTEVHHGFTLAPGAMGFKSNRPTLSATATGEMKMALPTYQAKQCADYQNDATTQMGNTDIYDVFSNVCTASGNAGKGKAVDTTAASKYSASVSVAGDSNNNAGCSIEYDPCIDTKTQVYLNRADVQQAIHVVPNLVPGGSWVGCSNIVNYSYSDLLSSMIPTYQYLVTTFPKGRYWVYSGDVDGIVPHTGTRFWMNSLGWPITTTLHPYNTPDSQVAGWSYTYTAPSGANLTYASVRNAGHMVPGMQGSRALQMFTTYLSGATP